MTDATHDIVIAGAGLVGLAAALAFARSDAFGPALVVDPAPPPSGGDAPSARALAVSAASEAMLEALGVWPMVADRAQPITDIDITDSRLSSPLRTLFLQFQSTLSEGRPAARMLDDGVLMRALYAAAAADDRIVLAHGRRVVGLEPGDGAITVVLDDGRRIAAGLCVAADGRGSNVRKLARIKTVGWSYPQTGIVTTVAHDKPHEARAVQHFLPAGPFAILPLKGDRSSLVWTEETAEATRIMGLDDDGFRDALAQRFGRHLGAVTLDGPRAAFPLSLHLARALAKPHLALVGDAARGVHPLAGQGFNIGLRDVAALVEVAVDARRVGLAHGAAPAMERYECWRRFDSAVSAFAMDGLNRLFSTANPVARLARDAGMGLVDRIPALKRMFVEEAAGITGEVPRLLRGENV